MHIVMPTVEVRLTSQLHAGGLQAHADGFNNAFYSVSLRRLSATEVFELLIAGMQPNRLQMLLSRRVALKLTSADPLYIATGKAARALREMAAHHSVSTTVVARTIVMDSMTCLDPLKRYYVLWAKALAHLPALTNVTSRQ